MIKKFRFILAFSYICSVHAMDMKSITLIRECANKFVSILESSNSFEKVLPMIRFIKEKEFSNLKKGSKKWNIIYSGRFEPKPR